MNHIEPKTILLLSHQGENQDDPKPLQYISMRDSLEAVFGKDDVFAEVMRYPNSPEMICDIKDGQAFERIHQSNQQSANKLMMPIIM